MFKKKVFLFLTTLFLVFFPVKIFANECDLSKCDSQSDTYENCLNNMATICSKQKDTLSNQIKILNSQYELTQLKITQTENSIQTLDREINDLTVKIGDLDKKLNQLASIYVIEIIQNYKLQKNVPTYAFLFSGNFNEFLEQYKYVANVQKASQNSMINMQTIKTDYDTQKEQKAQKQQEMENLQKTLAAQKISLNSQKSAKDQLLKVTESEYQKIQSQLAALRAFSSQGNTCLSSSPGGGSDGNYYSQRDPRWCKQTIGLSSDTIGAVGCFINSICMAYKKIGSDISPSSYASNTANFVGNTAWMSAPSVPSGYSYRQTSYNASTVDAELKTGRFVIAQMKMNNGVGMHFIVLISGSNGNYKIHDPWFGADQDFSSRYSTMLIMSIRLITK